MSRTGIVLAGGRSRRFGSDKLAAPFDGGTVLGAAIQALSSVVDGLIVAGTALPDGFRAGDVPVALVPDANPDGGPLVALAHVLAFAETDPSMLAVVVGGDMPRLVPGVLALMLETLDADASIGAAYLGRPEAPITAKPSEPSRRQVLPLAIRVQPAARAAREAVEAGRRSLQALLDGMTAFELPASTWLPFDPDGWTLTDVDTRSDLDRLQAT
jgi:molybdopterin-guanine dinucleotide biosynthesis protein A